MNDLIKKVDEYINSQANLDLLRFITCGSVDDGKSTLIGRVLYEAQLIFEDQVTSLKRESKNQGSQDGDIDLALLVDGLAAEREQGITIDVAYRFFSTERRKFIVADTPGHEQYTRNMATGASTADVAVILIDASSGLMPQSYRHSFICSLLGIKHVALIVNKMDLADFDQSVFQKIVSDYETFAKDLDFESITPIPVSALRGDNVIERSSRMKWYSGPTFIGLLETIDISNLSKSQYFRMPVQWVNRPNQNFRGFSGTVVSGGVTIGDTVKVLPSGETADVKDIALYSGSKNQALTDEAVTLVLSKEIDCSRGDIIVQGDSPVEVADQFQVNLVWLDSEPGHQGRSYLIKTQVVQCGARLSEIKFKYNINNLDHLVTKQLNLNDIGVATISLDKAAPYESYKDNRALGSFILIDRYTNATVAAGMINFALRRAQNIHVQNLGINKNAREILGGHKARVLWFTGLSGSGKSAIANALEERLHKRGYRTYILDGDNVRHGLNRDLGFSVSDRVENIRRIAEVANLMVDAGLIVLVSFISPFKAERDMARRLFDDGEFVEVYVDTPLEEAEKRDVKGLYAKARRGELPNFTGIDSPYEAPENPEIRLDTDKNSIEESVEDIVKFLQLE